MTLELDITIPKKSDDDIRERLKLGPQPGSVWSHRKTGKLYAVICCAARESDLMTIVIYRSATNSNAPIFARPISEWIEVVNGEQRYEPYLFAASEKMNDD